MLSDEEKKAIEMIEHIQECNTLIGYRVEDRTILAKALLNLIEKQSKEIEELKEDKYGLEEEVQIQSKNLMLCENALSEIQDKIKAKIEELNNTLKNTDEIEAVFIIKQQQVLQSLLEKE